MSKSPNTVQFKKCIHSNTHKGKFAAVRIIVHKAHKSIYNNPQVIHSTPVFQLMSCVGLYGTPVASKYNTSLNSSIVNTLLL